MTEIELKLQVPAAARAAVERAVRTPGATSTRLQALYYDTPDRRLAAAGIALRLRKEGRRWVQTLKCGPAHGMARGEHNVVLPGGRGVPALDPARHAGTPPGAALAAVLDAGAPPLAVQYRTDIRRTHRPLRSRRGTVELALDIGEIVGGDADGALRWPVCELEVELLRGAPQAVTEVAGRFAARHGLWLDTRSKAERGDRLARGLGPQDPVPPVKAAPLRLARDADVAAAWSAVLDHLLAHALPNWSEVAAGRGGEAVHQLRVALRRLRSARRFFAGWPGVPAADPADGDAAAALFRALGTARDAEVLAQGVGREIAAALEALGEAPLPAPPADTDTAAAPLASPAAAGHCWIALQAERLAMDEPAATGAPAPRLAPLAAQRLDDWHRRVQRDARRFDTLTDAERHRLRKRLKRLRYAAEFCAGLFPARAVRRYLARLADVQEQLGALNDLGTALLAYRRLAEQMPRAAFALGWLAARREVVLADCAREARRLRKAEPFWPAPKRAARAADAPASPDAPR